MNSAHQDDVAIIGMACRVAGADSTAKLWEILTTSKDVQSEITRFNVDGYYKPDGGPRKGLTNVRRAYTMDQSVEHFDSAFFSISPTEAEAMDPQQRMLLEIAYETLENAGLHLDEFQGTDTAVFAASIVNDYHSSLLRDIDQTPKYQATGTSNAILSNRISYIFDLHGPSVSVDTACSGTMVGLHQAVTALKAGEAEMALVCGVNAILSPDMFVHMSELGFLSPSGRCRSFDASGDGYARGEGVAAMLLKPLSTAIRDNDPIRAVIKGTRLNQDGRSKGMTMPSGDAQRRNLEALYSRPGLAPADVQYIEAHGTGTAVGDPIELAAIDSVFGKSHVENKLIVGSIKSNIGHLESVAALAGMIKTVEALERGLIPPQMNFKIPNPKICWDRIHVPTTVMSWPTTKDGIRRAGVNSFGFGGTNGHAVLESYDRKSLKGASEERPYLFKVSAATTTSLQALAKSYAEYTDRTAPSLFDLSHTLLARRSTMRQSFYAVASSQAELVDILNDGISKTLTRSANSIRNLAFVFTGQGAQWPQMGKQLLETSLLFRIAIEECDATLAELHDRPDWTISEELQRPKSSSNLSKASFAQPICCALQIGLVQLWKSWGIRPRAVIGHSSGEIGAAYAAGLLSLRDAIVIAYYRGLYLGEKARLEKGTMKKGSMAAVGLSETKGVELTKMFDGRIWLGAVNSPSSCTISGEADAIEEMAALCKRRGTFCRILRVDMAYHSHLMLPFAPAYEKAMRNAGIREPDESQMLCPMFSSVTGKRLIVQELSPTYWKDNMVSTVRFSDALQQLIQEAAPDAVIEVGPHPALSGPARDTMASLGLRDVPYFHSCYRGKPDRAALLESVGEMIPTGLRVKWHCINALEILNGSDVLHEVGSVLTDVPRYQWDHSVVHWGESRVSLNVRHRRFPRHELLGSRVPTDIPVAPSWRNVLSRKDIEWLDELATENPTAMPTTVFLLMIFEAARQLYSTENLIGFTTELRGIEFLSSLALEDISVETLFNFRQVETHEWKFEIFSSPSRSAIDSWSRHCVGKVVFSEEKVESGFQYPFAAQGQTSNNSGQSLDLVSSSFLTNVQVSSGGFNADFDKHIDGHENYFVHPAVIASLLHGLEGLAEESAKLASYRLSSIDLLELFSGTKQLEEGSIQTNIISRNPVDCRAEVVLSQNHDVRVRMSGVNLRINHLIQRKPQLGSMFFTRHVKPDITYMSISSKISFAQMVERITHKWPMSDICAISLDLADIASLFTELKCLGTHERSRFRSLDILGEAEAITSPKVRILEEMDVARCFTLMMGTATSVRKNISQVLDGGYVCLFLENEEDEMIVERDFLKIAELVGLQKVGWVLAKPRSSLEDKNKSNRLKAFATPSLQTGIFNDLFDAELSILEHGSSTAIGNSCLFEDDTDPYDVIVFDMEEKSILSIWDGQKLLPWIQSLLPRVRNLLWVSDQKLSNPYQGVAASFLKTVQAELPSIQVSSVTFQDTADQSFLVKSVQKVLEALKHGNREPELIVRDDIIHNVRYHPDDQLSASLGLIPPVRNDRSLASKSYSLALTGPRQVTLFSERPEFISQLAADKIRIKVTCSVIDDIDVLNFWVGQQNNSPWTGFGHFFSGVVLSSTNPKFDAGARILGWHPDAHRDVIEASTDFVYRIPNKLDESVVAQRFSAYMTALSVVSGAIRARLGDTLFIEIPGTLGEALIQVCEYLKISIGDGDQSQADFVITLNKQRGLLVNGQSIKTTRYMKDKNLQHIAKALSFDGLPFAKSPSVYHVGDYLNAFAAANADLFSTVLSHRECEDIGNRTMVRYESKPLFRKDGCYVLVGGLGGLGKHITTWMVQNGARHISLLSRSGPNSQDSSRLLSDMDRLGARVDIVKCDATKENELLAALILIRKTAIIRGCINLAMILADSAISSMTAEEWNRAVQVKIQSTWNLHNATLGDPLDFFVMFSSISAIFGNRTQSNYATGNAFLNSMAEYRRSQDLPATAIGLSPVTGIGVLANNEELLRTFRVSGLVASDAKDLNKTMEAAILESRCPGRSTIVTGFEMFESTDGNLQSSPDQTQVYWTESPEFGFLLDHKYSDSKSANEKSLLEHLELLQGDQRQELLSRAFLRCLESVMGQDESSFDPSAPLSLYGVDSLNAVGIRYWFFKQIGIDVPVFDILGSKSIQNLLSNVLSKISRQSSSGTTTSLPQPERLQNLETRPLSHSQRRMWFMNRLLPDKSIYNLLLVHHVQGTVSPTLLARTWTIFMQRHEVLRSRILDTSQGLQQIPVPDLPFDLEVIDSSESDFTAQVKNLTKIAKNHPFDLEDGKIIRGWLLRSPNQARFFLASHHIAWDRSSVPVIFSETKRIYRSILNGDNPLASLQPVSYQFIDYTIWQEKCLAEKELMLPLTEFWRETLNGIPESVSLLPFSITDRRALVKEYRTGTVTQTFDAELAAGIKTFCRLKAATPFMLMASALSAVIGKLTGDNDVVIGIPDGDRGHSTFDSLVGFTVNMLPIRSKPRAEISFNTFLEEYRTTCLKAYEHRAMPFDYLIQQLDITRTTSNAPVFQITVNYQTQGSFPECDFSTFKYTKFDHYNAKTQSDFALEIEELASGELACLWDFDEQLYDKKGIEAFAELFQVFVRDIVGSDGRKTIQDLQTISEVDLNMISSILQPTYEDMPSLSELNSTLFLDLFSSAVHRFPDKIALSDDDRCFTYTELNARANAISNKLIQNGSKVGDNVAICSEQNTTLMTGIYGILKAGCGYVPIDPDFPVERIQTMIEDIAVQKVLVESRANPVGQRILTCGIEMSNMLEIEETSGGTDADTSLPILSRPISNTDPFCCIFTSGSTGRPKGVVLNHGQLRYQMEGYNDYIGVEANSRILLSSAVVFDMCLPAVYGMIQYGATLYVASREARYSGKKMASSVIRNKITSCIFTPTQAKILFNAANHELLKRWTEIDSFVLGGEPISSALVRDFYRILPNARLYNGYAPSETTVINALRHVTIDDTKYLGMPLEGPIFPARFHILDQNMRPVPFGLPGELYISGPNVSKGYVNRPDVTAKAFGVDIGAPTAERELGYGSLYRTGDSFRLSRNGTLEIRGRIGSDRQVKIRGMRTELEEIENAIWDCYDAAEDDELPKLSLVAVVYHKHGANDGVLASYLATNDGTAGSPEEHDRCKEYIRLSLKAVLAPHMLPAAYVFADDLPRTVSGKIDYKAIVEWPLPAIHTTAVMDDLEHTIPELQELIATVWRDVLGISQRLTGSNDFFALGGHSLLLINVQQKIKEACGVTIGLSDMFAYPSIAGLEALIKQDPLYSAPASETSPVEATALGADKTGHSIDWSQEGSLDDADWTIPDFIPLPPASIVVTGATTMIGVHFLHHMLTTTTVQVHCIAIQARDEENALAKVIETMSQWNLNLSTQNLHGRLYAYSGHLSKEDLGLEQAQIIKLDQEADAIYHFDSDVSLLKNYEDIRAGNVDSLRFLIDLSRGKTSGKVKTLHYLSTWGVPHLQSWNTTRLKSPSYLTGEDEMINMEPGSESTLGYLKCRWVCELLLYQASRRGLPVAIYRSCMVGSNKTSNQGLDRTDINRRILESILQTGLVPDFNSSNGGGMSWINLSFLIKAIAYLSIHPSSTSSKPSTSSPSSSSSTSSASFATSCTTSSHPSLNPQIYNLTSPTHLNYKNDLPTLLGPSYAGRDLKPVHPEIWAQALRDTGNPEMEMQAETLLSWYNAGWTPFQLDARETLDVLEREAGLKPPVVDKKFLLERVVGMNGF